jgi:hypothetical protein
MAASVAHRYETVQIRPHWRRTTRGTRLTVTRLGAHQARQGFTKVLARRGELAFDSCGGSPTPSPLILGAASGGFARLASDGRCAARLRSTPGAGGRMLRECGGLWTPAPNIAAPWRRVDPREAGLDAADRRPLAFGACRELTDRAPEGLTTLRRRWMISYGALPSC